MAGPPVRLVCPLCDAVVNDGDPPEPGVCPSCGARFEGDGESAPEAVARALEVVGVTGFSAEDVAMQLFTIDPHRAREFGVTITSDQRAGFYRWWVFFRDGVDPRETIGRLTKAAGVVPKEVVDSERASGDPLS